jgi:hypothetical protein
MIRATAAESVARLLSVRAWRDSLWSSLKLARLFDRYLGSSEA